ncbi:MAG TPA: hypothetical protein VIA98_09860 [Allosphingosinicella sp.]|jgi:hypothetical protein
MRSIIGGLAALSLVAVAAAPAEAGQRHHRRHHDSNVDGGDVVAGALVIGAIAALASSNSHAKQDRAVDTCSSEAETRIGGRVSDIFGVSKRKGYYTVEGAVDGDVGSETRFTCTIRRGVLYSFRTGREDA